jgi:hypothetical protein
MDQDNPADPPVRHSGSPAGEGGSDGEREVDEVEYVRLVLVFEMEPTVEVVAGRVGQRERRQ